VTGPVADAGDLRASYEQINRLLLAGLNTLGAAAAVATSSRRAASPGLAPCFAEPSTGELVLGERKLAGSAQYRADGAILQHGSILVEDDQWRLAGLADGGIPAPPPPATLREALGRDVSPAEATGALVAAIEDHEGTVPRTLPLDDGLRARMDALIVRYLDDGWTWRR
jgi:lipoate-protein ligase A